MRHLLWLAGLLPVGTLLTQACGLESAQKGPAQPPTEAQTPPNTPPAESGDPFAAPPARPEQDAGSGPTGATRLQRDIAGDPSVIVLPPHFNRADRRPALIFFHGHGMDEHQMLQRTQLAQRASEAGWLAAAGYAGSRGHWGNDAALRATAALLNTLVRDYGADAEHLFLVGFSMGGGTALLAAANPLRLPYRIAAVASSQGYSDLVAMAELPPYRTSIYDAYGGAPGTPVLTARSPLEIAEELRGTALYLEHGEADTAVPAHHTTRLRERLETLGIPVEVRLYPGVGHHEDSINEAAIMRFFQGIYQRRKDSKM